MEPSRTETPFPSRGRTFRVALVAIMLFVIAACGDDGATTTTAGSSATTSATETTAGGSETTADPGTGEPVEITIWFARDYVPPDQFASLEAEHNVRVTYDVRPGDNMGPTMLEMREAGEPLPDMIEIDTFMVAEYAAADLFQPMTEYVDRFAEEDPELFETVIPSVWEDGTFDGEIMHAAWQSAYDMLYYNVALFEEAGIEVPFNSWWDVVDAARAIKALHPDMTSVYGSGTTSEDPLFHYLTNFGAPFDGAVPDLTSPGGLDWISWMQTLRAEGLINPGYMVGDQDEAQGAFMSGNGAFVLDNINGGFDYIEAVDFPYGEEGWLTTPMPKEEGGEHMQVPRGWSIVKESEHPYEATLALRYLMDPVNGIPRYLQGSSTPRSSAILGSPEVGEAQPYFTEEIRDLFLSDMGHIPFHVNTMAVGAILLDLRDELFIAGTEDSPEDIAARWQPLLDELK